MYANTIYVLSNLSQTLWFALCSDEYLWLKWLFPLVLVSQSDCRSFLPPPAAESPNRKFQIEVLIKWQLSAYMLDISTVQWQKCHCLTNKEPRSQRAWWIVLKLFLIEWDQYEASCHCISMFTNRPHRHSTVCVSWLTVWAVYCIVCVTCC